MTDLSEIKEVRELNRQNSVNKHLANGWVLLSVASASDDEAHGLVTKYVLGWLSSERAPQEYEYD